jgi:hypothetical protein
MKQKIYSNKILSKLIFGKSLVCFCNIPKNIFGVHMMHVFLVDIFMELSFSMLSLVLVLHI